MANCFIEDLAARLPQRIQLSSDALRCYNGAVERAFGANVDHGSIIKTFSHTEQRRYSPPEVIKVEKLPVTGNPDVDLISTRYVEKQNHPLRMHCRRLSRLTNAFSKKIENFRACHCVALCLLQFREDSQDHPLHPGNGSGCYQELGSFLGVEQTAGFRAFSLV